METVTISISKVITKITNSKLGGVVTTHKLSQLIDVVSSLESFYFVGTAKPNKLGKYENVLLSNGFVLSDVDYKKNAGFEGENSDVIDFRISYKKI